MTAENNADTNVKGGCIAALGVPLFCLLCLMFLTKSCHASTTWDNYNVFSDGFLDANDVDEVGKRARTVRDNPKSSAATRCRASTEAANAYAELDYEEDAQKRWVDDAEKWCLVAKNVVPLPSASAKLLSPDQLRERGMMASRIPQAIIDAKALAALAESDPEKFRRLFGEGEFFLKGKVTRARGKQMRFHTGVPGTTLTTDVTARVLRLWNEPDDRIWKDGGTVILDCAAAKQPLGNGSIKLGCGSSYRSTIARVGVPLDADQLQSSSSLSNAVLAKCKQNPRNRPCYQANAQFARLFFTDYWRKLPDAEQVRILKEESALWN